MRTLVVYCHPSKDSFTFMAKEALVKGLKDGTNDFEISDLYQSGFNPVISEEEYLREGYYIDNDNIPDDVKKEQSKIERADNIVFVFPNFWTSAPAMLEGWFQRVWTYGFAYGPKRMKVLEKAIFLMTMGGSLKDEIRQEQVEAIKCTMLGDRMYQRAKKCNFIVFDEMTRGYDNDMNRQKRMTEFCNQIYKIGVEL